MRKVRKQFFLYTKVLPLLVLSLLLLAGCGAEKNMKKAEKFMAIGEYYDAASQYKQAYSKTPPKERDRRGLIAGKMAVCYRKINSTPKAVAAYRNMVRYNKATVDDRLELGRQLLKNGDYKQAAEQFRVVLDSMPDNVLARNGLLSAQQAPAWKKQGSRYTVKRMDVFNSRRAEYSPMLSGDQFDQLYFSSTRNDATGDELSGITGTKNGDIFVSQKDDKGKWSKPEVVNGGLNSEADEGASCLSPDQREMYLTQCVTDPSYPRYAQIVKSNRSDAAWGKASSVELTKDTLSCFAHPAVSPDGQWLYFVSDMPGGKGGLDIWRVRITSAGYGGVENLGEPINTPGNEMFPTFRPNGDLYFSSDGHPGMGGLDLFRAQLTPSGGWSVVNMGIPMNSAYDDFGITFGEGESGFFSSNRNDARGYDHIYSFVLPDLKIYISGMVLDKDEEPVPNAVIRIVGNDGSIQKESGRADGSFRFPLQRGVSYVMMAGAKGYLNAKQEFTADTAEEDAEYGVDFILASINKPVVIENVFYDFDKADLRPETKTALDEMAQMLRDNPNVTIEMASHTDRKGSDEYNLNLSHRRAQSVIDYLIAAGISEKRLQPQGYGESRPKTITKRLAREFPQFKEGDVLTEEYIEALSEEDQEVADQINRRTEFQVLSIDYQMF